VVTVLIIRSVCYMYSELWRTFAAEHNIARQYTATDNMHLQDITYPSVSSAPIWKVRLFTSSEQGQYALTVRSISVWKDDDRANDRTSA
jgi:hypothetical protein